MVPNAIEDLPAPEGSRSGWPWDQPKRSPFPEMPAFSRNDWPRITVVTPSFNQVHFVECTLRSILLPEVCPASPADLCDFDTHASGRMQRHCPAFAADITGSDKRQLPAGCNRLWAHARGAEPSSGQLILFLCGPVKSNLDQFEYLALDSPVTDPTEVSDDLSAEASMTRLHDWRMTAFKFGVVERIWPSFVTWTFDALGRCRN